MISTRASISREIFVSLKERLLAAQQADGCVPIAPAFHDAAWPTPFCLLAWLQDSDCVRSVDRAVEFLLNWRGAVFQNRPEVLGHNTMLTGWPWVSNTHSWIEPTGMALLALQAAGHRDAPRCIEARELMLNRQLPGGGWNYGNTTVYHHELRPMAHSTAIALSALAGFVDESKVERSLRYLTSVISSLRSPLSLAWALTAFQAWNSSTPDSAQWVNECLEQEGIDVTYDLFLIALLRCALEPRQTNPLLKGMNP
jgi:hypothetical protein